MTKTEPKTLHLPALDQIEIIVFQLKGSDNLYILAPFIKATHELSDHPMLSWIDKHQYIKIDSASNCLSNEERFFLVCSVDCYHPPQYVVSVLDESDAVQEFITNTKICVIEKSDYKDYIDNDAKADWCKDNPVEDFEKAFEDRPWDFFVESVTTNDNGEPCDTENIHWDEVFPVLVIRKPVQIK